MTVEAAYAPQGKKRHHVSSGAATNANDMVVDNDFDHQMYAEEEDETARTGRWGNSSESDGVGLGPGVDTVIEDTRPTTCTLSRRRIWKRTTRRAARAAIACWTKT